MMIRIGRFEFGFAPLSMVMLFVVSSIFAISYAVSQARPEWPMPVSGLIIINESVALLATLVYGILLHAIMTLRLWIKAPFFMRRGLNLGTRIHNKLLL